MEELAGKVAVVTGAASGIGEALAGRFADAGMRVVLADIESDPLGAVADRLRTDGAEVEAVLCDVSDAADVGRVAEVAIERFGGLHLACNNAGVGSGGPMWELTTEDWEWVLGVNLWGVIHGISSFVPRIIESGGGHVVNTASVAGLVSVPFMGPYNASKHAVVTLSETLLAELRISDHPIGVSVLCPAWVRTRILDSGRNRPFAKPDAEPGAVGAMAIAGGLDPSAVAERVEEAVRADEFYILTHPESAEAVESRHRHIVDRGQPYNV